MQQCIFKCSWNDRCYSEIRIEGNKFIYKWLIWGGREQKTLSGDCCQNGNEITFEIKEGFYSEWHNIYGDRKSSIDLNHYSLSATILSKTKELELGLNETKEILQIIKEKK